MAGEAVGVASARLYSNVSNYYVRTATDGAYGLRAVALGRLPPPGRYASASKAAGPRRGVDSSVSSLVTCLFLFKGDSITPGPRVEVPAPPAWPLACARRVGLLFASLNSSIAVGDT